MTTKVYAGGGEEKVTSEDGELSPEHIAILKETAASMRADPANIRRTEASMANHTDEQIFAAAERMEKMAADPALYKATRDGFLAGQKAGLTFADAPKKETCLCFAGEKDFEKKVKQWVPVLFVLAIFFIIGASAIGA